MNLTELMLNSIILSLSKARIHRGKLGRRVERKNLAPPAIGWAGDAAVEVEEYKDGAVDEDLERAESSLEIMDTTWPNISGVRTGDG